MNPDTADLIISATKPGGKPAALLAGMGVAIVPMDQSEGNVDRYILSKRLAIDRRTGSSFLRGIMDKTLFTSAIYLREHFAIPILIVEGTVNHEYSAFDPRAVRGATSAMMLEYGLSVLATPDVEETVAVIAMMARQEQVGIPEISLIPKRKATELADMQRRVVEMLPGSGMVVARELLQHFGSVRRIVGATEAEFRAMRGIGAKKAREIGRVLAAEYESVDTEKDIEDAIEADPKLLFRRPVRLLARQHHIYTEGKERHVVDLVFLDRKASEVILVELKRGRLLHEHAKQLRRYLDHAGESVIVGEYLAAGAGIRGLLATVAEGTFTPKARDVSACVVDRKRVIGVLKRLRDKRLGGKG